MANRLINEKSPYLLQHANNPVDWYPWGEEAFDKAKNDDKPIFLSIGYSTCHWCHVMEKESFEDMDVAKLMNDTFISIKVDREEMPDVDRTFMEACQMMTGTGGWPLTIIMTPEKKPFFAATYIPKQSMHGMAGLIHLIPQLKQVWKENRKKAVIISEEIALSLKQQKVTSKGMLDESAQEEAYQNLVRSFDRQHGGFGHALKFPLPLNLLFLLRHSQKNKNTISLKMVEKSLYGLGLGGIFDHIGGGFHRYSTDEKWLVPHFEKMLYDQALIGIAYCEAYQKTKNEFFRSVADKTYNYVLSQMKSTAGVFFTAEDADSDGGEGNYYLWTIDELKNCLEEKEARLFIKAFNIKKYGNTEDPQFYNRNIPYLDTPIDSDDSGEMESIIEKLLRIRQKRIRPSKDDKILVDWNGLMIASLAIASRVFDNDEYLNSAEIAMGFFLDKISADKGMLSHIYYDGRDSIKANIDDYAFIIWALIELYGSTFEEKYLREAEKLTLQMIKYFYDKKEGGFYFTSEHDEKIIQRNKDAADNVIPSGSSVAISNLIRLSRMNGKEHLLKIAEETIRSNSYLVGKFPTEHLYFLSASGMLGEYYEFKISAASKEVAIGISKVIERYYIPGKTIVFIEDRARKSKVKRSKKAIKSDFKVSICDKNSCREPIIDLTELKKTLEFM